MDNKPFIVFCNSQYVRWLLYWVNVLLVVANLEQSLALIQ